MHYRTILQKPSPSPPLPPSAWRLSPCSPCAAAGENKRMDIQPAHTLDIRSPFRSGYRLICGKILSPGGRSPWMSGIIYAKAGGNPHYSHFAASERQPFNVELMSQQLLLRIKSPPKAFITRVLSNRKKLSGNL